MGPGPGHGEVAEAEACTSNSGDRLLGPCVVYLFLRLLIRPCLVEWSVVGE